MPTAITWPVGKRLTEVAKRDYSWSFGFSAGGCVTTESAWRLISENGISVTSEDHGQRFGSDKPVDAGARVLAATKGMQVEESRLVEGTSDLLLRFEKGVRLEFLNLSCGFETWRATHGSEDVICMGGGALLLNEKKG